jgi:transposase-like protein
LADRDFGRNIMTIMEGALLLNAVIKKYDKSFKRQAVEMVLRGGKTVKEAAESLE